MMCLNRRVSIEGQPRGSLDRCLMPSKAPGSGKQQGNRGGGLDRGAGQDTPPAPRGPGCWDSCSHPLPRAPWLLRAERSPWASRRPSLYLMSWSPNSWATRPRSAPSSPWSQGAGSSTAPLASASRCPHPGWTTPGTAGRGTPPACGCSAASSVRGAPRKWEGMELGSDGALGRMGGCLQVESPGP